MVQFAKKLAAAQRPEWSGHYLEYKQLKKKLKAVLASAPTSTPSATSSATAAKPTTADDAAEDSPLTPRPRTGRLPARAGRRGRARRALLPDKQGEFAQTLAQLRREQAQLGAPDLAAMHALADRFRRMGDELVQLLHYVELNATGLRKILKKHDKLMKGRKIMGSYLTSRTDSQASHLQQLYHDEGISAIIATIRTALTDLRKREVELATVDADAAPVSVNTLRSPVTALALPPLPKEEAAVILKRSISEDEPVLSKIALARRRLQQSTQYVKTIAAQALIFDGESSEDEDEASASAAEGGYISFRPRARSSEISRFINMSCTFLYMINYYIVAPTSGDYAAALGAEEALSGVIVGMTPIASLVSAVLYSWWANRSYKSPLVFATVCLVVGNLLYGLALYFDSIAMAIAGRLLNGFGGARAPSTDATSPTTTRARKRTQASAMFVTASALGMAAGPALAAALDYAPDFAVMGVQVTTETAPGYLMFVFWLVYLVATLVWFEEPERQPASDRLYPYLEHRQSLIRASATSMEHGKAGEKTPLLPLSNAHVHAHSHSHAAPPLSSLWHNVPVVATLLIYIVLKLVLECLLTASSTIGQYYFKWNSTDAGLYLAMLGLLMFPTNVVVSWLCVRYEDRELILMSEGLMLVGVAVIVRYTQSYSVVQFVLGGVIIFISTNVLEGVNMSLLSKTIPRAFARGTFNSGLLATEAGTLGRAIGDVAITVVGLPGIQYVLNWTFAPLVVTCILTIAYTWRVFPKLATRDD
ncbi:hypothetical protein PINS_up009989 [Pythium insidiosum]|nr:hypothetical protein PINS_up009989 [Pythium insidiosum]